METIWFCLVALMLTVYTILDGFDLGAGIVHFLVAHSDRERRTVLGAIGPVWDGNEVWLIAAGGTLFFAFPALYASSFSGFYLPLMIVLWLLILRGLSIELRNHAQVDLWRSLCDAVFTFSGGLLALFFGTALGNVVRGVPLDKEGFFFLPLWTSFLPGANCGILDWYTVSVGAAAAVTLTVHGALWLAIKTEEEISGRAQRLARRMWWPLAVLTLTITGLSFRVQPHLRESFASRPWGYCFPVLALAGLLGVRLLHVGKGELMPFLSSCAFIGGMLASVAFGLFPYVLPSNADRALGLTIYNAQTAYYGLYVGLQWWIPAMLLAAGYFFFVYRHFLGKVRLDHEEGSL